MDINLETILLENEELKFLSEFTPYAEGSGLADFMDEAIGIALNAGRAMCYFCATRRM